MTASNPYSGVIYTDNGFRKLPNLPEKRIINPASLEEEGYIVECDAGVVKSLIQKSRDAQNRWKDTDAKSRAFILHELADAIQNGNMEPVAKQMTLEMGKPYPEAMGEIANAAPVFRYYAELARDDGGSIAGTTRFGSFQYSTKEPYGISVHIVPFNFPILLMCWTVAASLAAGNTCLVKPAEVTTLSTMRFMKFFGVLPENLVQCITGGAGVARSLIKSEGTDIVAFTGGVDAAREVNVTCAERLKPCIIEAGGNDSMIISDKAPLDVAVPGSVCAAFHLSGQICTSAERFFVHDKIHDEFVARFVAATKKLRIGHGLEKSEIGPMVSEAARDKVENLVLDAVRQGAVVETGGRRPRQFRQGWFYEPTILTNMSPEMRIMQTEVFGPVAGICRVSSVEEGLEFANQSNFGLGSSIFTTDLKEAYMAADRYQTGMVWVNNPLIDNDALPFGGWKMSGMGRELGREGLNAFRQSKMVIMDHDPAIHDWWYPYNDDVFHKANS